MKSKYTHSVAMEDLVGPMVQLVLSVKEGNGFGFLTSPIVVVASLNGHRLETDVLAPCADPLFNTELVWEADKKNIRRLRAANTPVKVVCFTVPNSQRRDRIGYILLNLKQAHIVPRGSEATVAETWHRVLGVRTDAVACSPMMMLSLRIVDHQERPSNTDGGLPVKILSQDGQGKVNPTGRSVHQPKPLFAGGGSTVGAEGEGSTGVEAVHGNLTPLLYVEEDIIQLGPPETAQHTFHLSIHIGAAVNLAVLLPRGGQPGALCLCYRVMGYSVRTKALGSGAQEAALQSTVNVDERIVLRLRSSLRSLRDYFKAFPSLTLKLCRGDAEIGSASLDLKGLVPTDSLEVFCSKFSAAERMSCVEARCPLSPCIGPPTTTPTTLYGPHVELFVSLIYIGPNNQPPPPGPPQSHLMSGAGDYNKFYDKSSANCSVDIVEPFVPNLALTEPEAALPVEQPLLAIAAIADSSFCERTRSANILCEEGDCCSGGGETYRADGDRQLHCYQLSISLDSIQFYKLPPDGRFTFRMHHPRAMVACSAHAELRAARVRERQLAGGVRGEVRLSCKAGEVGETLLSAPPRVMVVDGKGATFASATLHTGVLLAKDKKECSYSVALEAESRGAVALSPPSTPRQLGLLDVTMALRDCGLVQDSRTASPRTDVEPTVPAPAPPVLDESLAYKVIDELEDWKEKQQEICRYELKRKEDEHLRLLSAEWSMRRSRLEEDLNTKVEHCRGLARSLTEATDGLRAHGRRNAEKELELLRTKEELEQTYNLKYQELREASKRLQDDMDRKLSLLSGEKEDLVMRIEGLERERAKLFSTIAIQEDEIDRLRNGNVADGLTKDQMASLCQEMKGLELKLEDALRSKAFFKEQWGKAVREIHRIKSECQDQIQVHVCKTKEELRNMGLQQMVCEEERQMRSDQLKVQNLRTEVEGLQRTRGATTQQTNSAGLAELLRHSKSGGCVQSIIMDNHRPSERDFPDELTECMKVTMEDQGTGVLQQGLVR